MKKLVVLFMALLVSGTVYSQIIKEVKLSEVFITATNYKYLNEVDNTLAAIPVKTLEREVATYNLKDSDLYHDDYDLYQVSFFIPEGKILAAYDADGNILRTIERFKDIKLPYDVSYALNKRFPGWTIEKNYYRVNYKGGADASSSKIYKVKLKNGDKVINVKMDTKGNFL